MNIKRSEKVLFKRLVLLAAVALIGLGAAVLLGRSRMAACRYVPLVADELLPNSTLAPAAGSALPLGWSAPAPGVELHGPAIDGKGFALGTDGRALQLMGIANYVQTPPVPVQPGQSYCFAGQMLSDSPGSATRVRAIFQWQDSHGRVLAEDASPWQPVALWREGGTVDRWSSLGAAFQAPPEAAALLIRLQPASDDRIYLDDMHVRRTIAGAPRALPARRNAQTEVTLSRWPEGRAAALSLSFDWETAMGGLIHSRSDDPQGENWQARALRMREGITTTLQLFRPAGIRATYYATGYNFLDGNTDRQKFVGDPAFTWATPANGWPVDWSTRRWFADDPYGTVQTQPSWYFGDLIAPLQRERQDIQSHTFSHLYGGYARAEEWRADLAEWSKVAQLKQVAAARSLAFPWSSSAGMSDASWRELEQAGITSVTRTNWTQKQYDLFARDSRGFTPTPSCRSVPGHETILVCPDFYLTPKRAKLALAQIDAAITAGGMIDVWSHTEEVMTPEQLDAWTQVLHYAVRQRDAGKLWIAPLAEIASWQQALADVEIEYGMPPPTAQRSEELIFRVTNHSHRNLSGLTLTLPFVPEEITVDGQAPAAGSPTLTLNLPAGQSSRVTLLKASAR